MKREVLVQLAEECASKNATVLTISGPTAVGKDSILAAIENSDALARPTRRVLSSTTRDPRNEDEYYNYLSYQAFQELIDANLLLEYTSLPRPTGSVDYFGTTISELQPNKSEELILWRVDTMTLLTLIEQSHKDIELQTLFSFVYIGIDNLVTLLRRYKTRDTNWDNNSAKKFIKRLRHEYQLYLENKLLLDQHLVINSKNIDQTTQDILSLID